METATLPQVGVAHDPAPSIEAAEEQTRPQEAAATKASPDRMLKFSEFVHVGEGAAECEHGEDGQCQEPEHFHAWCRLPNKFQHRDIVDKAAAAAARRRRQLRDTESDMRTILEDEIYEMSDEQIIEALLRKDWAKDYLEAVKEVAEREEFAHIEQDRERLTDLERVERDRPEDERSEEYTELTAHVGSYVQALQEAHTAIIEPRRQALVGLGRTGIEEEYRKSRIEELAHEQHLHFYNVWMWFVGTLDAERHPVTRRPYKRKWPEMGTVETQEPGTMWGERPEAISAVEAAFGRLEVHLQDAVRGNS